MKHPTIPSTNTSTPQPRASDERIIALDGPGGAGKSTVAGLLAKRLGGWFLSSGWVYRAIAWQAMHQNIHQPLTPAQLEALDVALDDQGVLVNGVRVSEATLKTEEVSNRTSQWAALGPVRQKATRIQRQAVTKALAAGLPWVVLEGRDIATHVFPKARWMFFLHASADVRAQRRHQQLLEMHGKAPSLSDLRAAMEAREAQDSSREIAPLKPAKGALQLDVGKKTLSQVVDWLENTILQG